MTGDEAAVRAAQEAYWRWKELAMNIPEGYRPHTFASLVAKNKVLLPTMGTELIEAAAGQRWEEVAGQDDLVPEGDRQAVVPGGRLDAFLSGGLRLVERLEREGLVQFAENPEGEPAVFALPPEFFTDPEDLAAAGRLVAWFDRQGDWSVPLAGDEPKVTGLDGKTFEQYLAGHPSVVETVASETNLSRRVVEATLRDFWAHPQTLKGWVTRPETRAAMTRTQRAVWEAIDAHIPEPVKARWRGERPRHFAHQSYMQAVEAQYEALVYLEETYRIAVKKGLTKVDGMPLDELMATDVRGLRGAATYCWFKEPTHACDVAAASLPASTRLTREMLGDDPQPMGWWWFLERYPVKTTSDTDEIGGLLWQWLTASRDGAQGVRFSAFALDPKSGKPMPSTLFYWVEGESLATALERFGREYDEVYSQARHPHKLMGRDLTLHVVERLLRFFAAGSIWLQEKVLVYTDGAIERHERKRMARGAFQRPVSDVQVIELRRRMSVRMDGEHGHRDVDWQYRWIVRGFFREQWYPSEGVHKTKWIDSYVKGPDDRPLKVPTHTVYTVKR